MTAYHDRLLAGHYSNPDASWTDETDSDLTVEQLKDQLRQRDLPTSGSKAELQARLAEAAAE